MNPFTEFILPVFLFSLAFIWFAFVFYVLFSNISRRAKEKQLYRVMISNPNDLIVKNYIESFKKINGFSSSIFNLFWGSQHASDRMRQSQGYEIIKNSSSVSSAVKEQLKIVFISNGIQIK